MHLMCMEISQCSTNFVLLIFSLYLSFPLLHSIRRLTQILRYKCVCVFFSIQKSYIISYHICTSPPIKHLHCSHRHISFIAKGMQSFKSFFNMTQMQTMQMKRKENTNNIMDLQNSSVSLYLTSSCHNTGVFNVTVQNDCMICY